MKKEMKKLKLSLFVPLLLAAFVVNSHALVDLYTYIENKTTDKILKFTLITGETEKPKLIFPGEVYQEKISATTTSSYRLDIRDVDNTEFAFVGWSPIATNDPEFKWETSKFSFNLKGTNLKYRQGYLYDRDARYGVGSLDIILGGSKTEL